jgi:hypothetical protein
MNKIEKGPNQATSVIINDEHISPSKAAKSRLKPSATHNGAFIGVAGNFTGLSKTP